MVLVKCGGIEALVMCLRMGKDPIASAITASTVLDYLLQKSQNTSNSKEHSSSRYSTNCSISSWRTTQRCTGAKSAWSSTQDSDRTIEANQEYYSQAMTTESSDAEKIQSFANNTPLQDPSVETLDPMRRRDTKSATDFNVRQEAELAGVLSNAGSSDLLATLMHSYLKNEEHVGMKLLVSIVLFQLCVCSCEVRVTLSDIVYNGMHPLVKHISKMTPGPKGFLQWLKVKLHRS